MAKKSAQDLIKEYNRLATAIDKRQERLRNLSKQKSFEHVKEWAYAKAEKLVRSWYGPDAKSFRRKPPMKNGKVDTGLLTRRIKEMQDIMQLKSGTKTGILKTYKQRANTLNDKYGTDFKWTDLADFFESGEFEKNRKDYGSDTYTTAIGVLQENEKEILKAIKQKKDMNLKIEDEKVKETVEDIISRYGKKFTDLYK